MKSPNEVTSLDINLPKKVHPIGYGVQISYRSDKWNDNGDWIDYIHWWENPTLVCVPKHMVGETSLGFEIGESKVFDLGKNRNEVTFLGYAIDTNISEDDRSIIELSPEAPAVYTRELNPTEHTEELEKIDGTIAIPFRPDPGESRDFVVCSPNGRIVYVVSEGEGSVYAFINNKCRGTSHGIEGYHEKTFFSDRSPDFYLFRCSLCSTG